MTALTREHCTVPLKYAGRSGWEKQAAGKVISELSCNSLVLTKINDFDLKNPFLAMAVGPTGCDRQPLGCPRDPGLLSWRLGLTWQQGAVAQLRP